MPTHAVEQSIDVHVPDGTVGDATGSEQRFRDLQEELRAAYSALKDHTDVDGQLLGQIAAYAFEISPAEALLKDDLPMMEKLAVQVQQMLGKPKETLGEETVH